MNLPWALLIYEADRLVYTVDVSGDAELGRQRTAAEPVASCRREEGHWRVVIAAREVNAISRTFLRVRPQEGGAFELTNLSAKTTIALSDGRQLRPGACCLVDATVLIGAGDRALRLRPVTAGHLLQGLDEATIPPGGAALLPSPFAPGPTSATGVDAVGLLRWLGSLMDVLQSAATSRDFFDRAARALVDIVRLDSGAVLLRAGDRWHVRARYRSPYAAEGPDRPASQHILDRMAQEKRTFREAPAISVDEAASLQGVETVVAAPILNRNGAVLGALYGERRQESVVAGGAISEVEARLVELLAGGVAAGLARLEQEQKALAVQVQFEQFFTPELARHLVAQPDLLKGRDVEVSVLVCDVRGFSRVSERLGPEGTMDWIGHVLSELSGCVRAHEGVLVDYVGDELMAMWGAPGEQPDHAQRACQAALDMLACLPRLNERWQGRIGEAVAFGIGINTGVARVGNSGSQHKFKYGPLGNTVNLASRVQGATKHLKCPVLITGATEAKLGASFARRRLCRARVVNITAPIDLYELALPDRPGWAEAKAEYEQALASFERQEFRKVARRLSALRAQQPNDGPALVLLARAVNCMVEEPVPFDPVWTLPSK